MIGYIAILAMYYTDNVWFVQVATINSNGEGCDIRIIGTLLISINFQWACYLYTKNNIYMYINSIYICITISHKYVDNLGSIPIMHLKS